MADILLKSASFICIIALGYFLKRKRLFGPEDFRIPLKIVLNVTMPCAAIVNFASNPPDFSFLTAACLGFGMNCLMLLPAYFFSKNASRKIRAVWLNCAPGFNIGAFAMPFAQSFLSPASLVGVCLFDTGSSLMCNGTTYAISRNILDRAKGLNLKRIGNTLLHSVPFLTYFTLLLVTLADIPIDGGLVHFVTPAANANAFLAMFMVGMMLDLRIEKAYLKQISGILGLRLGMAAIASAVIYFGLPLSLELRQGLAIAVFAPASINSTAFGVQAGGDPTIAAGVNSVSILTCIVCTVSLLAVFGAL